MNNLDLYTREKTTRLHLDELHHRAAQLRLLRKPQLPAAGSRLTIERSDGFSVSLAVLNVAVTLCVCTKPA